MPNSLLKLTLLITLLLLPSLSSFPLSFDSDSDEEDYILDNPSPSTYLRHKLLAKIKKGTRCNALYNNVCNGVSANNGTSILHCCKKHCRNVLGDRNNCGVCGHKVGAFQKCCGGEPTDVLFNRYNCGKCFKQCKPGKKCENGICGYAY